MHRKLVPQRTCVACRRVRPARELIRVVRLPCGTVELDVAGKKPGRGAYLCPTRACWDAALSKELVGQALRTKIPREQREALRQHRESLPTSSP
jgi:predicted RNA-binding protein YlxR (DUF448 family)